MGEGYSLPRLQCSHSPWLGPAAFLGSSGDGHSRSGRPLGWPASPSACSRVGPSNSSIPTHSTQPRPLGRAIRAVAWPSPHAVRARPTRRVSRPGREPGAQREADGAAVQAPRRRCRHRMRRCEAGMTRPRRSGRAAACNPPTSRPAAPRGGGGCAGRGGGRGGWPRLGSAPSARCAYMRAVASHLEGAAFPVDAFIRMSVNFVLLLIFLLCPCLPCPSCCCLPCTSHARGAPHTRPPWLRRLPASDPVHEAWELRLSTRVVVRDGDRGRARRSLHVALTMQPGGDLCLPARAALLHTQ